MFITSTLRKVLHVQLDLAEKLCFTSACYRNGASAYGIFQEATESSVRFGSVFFRRFGSVRFGGKFKTNHRTFCSKNGQESSFFSHLFSIILLKLDMTARIVFDISDYVYHLQWFDQ